MRSRVVPKATLVILGLGWVVAAARAEDSRTFEVVDPDAVYYGQSSTPKSPAVIAADEVWMAIPEYKRIIDEELTDDDPRYHLLLKKATERFGRALDQLAKRDGYDLIAERGAVVVKGEAADAKIPDVTPDMVDLVSRD